MNKPMSLPLAFEIQESRQRYFAEAFENAQTLHLIRVLFDVVDKNPITFDVVNSWN